MPVFEQRYFILKKVYSIVLKLATYPHGSKMATVISGIGFAWHHSEKKERKRRRRERISSINQLSPCIHSDWINLGNASNHQPIIMAKETETSNWIRAVLNADAWNNHCSKGDNSLIIDLKHWEPILCVHGGINSL